MSMFMHVSVCMYNYVACMHVVVCMCLYAHVSVGVQACESVYMCMCIILNEEVREAL